MDLFVKVEVRKQIDWGGVLIEKNRVRTSRILPVRSHWLFVTASDFRKSAHKHGINEDFVLIKRSYRLRRPPNWGFNLPNE